MWKQTQDPLLQVYNIYPVVVIKVYNCQCLLVFHFFLHVEDLRTVDDTLLRKHEVFLYYILCIFSFLCAIQMMMTCPLSTMQSAPCQHIGTAWAVR